MDSKLTILAAVAAATLACENARADNLITNGSFDNLSGQFSDTTGQGGDNQVAPNAITGWTTAGNYSVLWISTPNTFNGLGKSPGNSSPFFVDLTGTVDAAPFDSISQTIDTIAGAQYSLTFDLGSSTSWGIQDSIKATAGDTSSTFVSTNPGGNTPNDWETETLNFTATGLTTLISFDGITGGQYIGLDNVDVEQTGVGAVPEPSTWAMMLLGFCGLGFMAYRRKQNGVALSVA
jgi:hypothetical protein